jgi:HlyD family secretion protein
MMSFWQKLLNQDHFKSTDLAGISKLTYFTLLITVLISLIWLFTAEISSAVIINGSIKVYRNRVVLQHPEGGRIAHVHVTEGQKIKTGELILELDNAQIDSNLRNLQRQSFSEHIRIERLKTEINYPSAFNPSTTDLDEEQLGIINTEKSLYTSRQRNLASQISALKEQIEYVKEEIRSLTETVDNDLVINKKNIELAEKGFMSSLGVINSNQALNQHQADLSRAKQRISEMQQKIPVLINDFKNNAANEYRSVSERFLEIEEKLKPTEETYKNLKVFANADGTIVNLTKLGQGSVLGAKETIAEIVPKNYAIILEGNLPTEQVAFVKEGMPTRVSIAQLKQMGGQELSGIVKTVSADSVSQGMLGTWSYIVQIEITKVNSKEAGLIRPGMPAEIYIQTGARTPYDYLTHPISTFMNRAGKEPN